MTNRPHPDPDGNLFDQIYAASRGGDPRAIPWSHGAPHPMFQTWLDQAGSPQQGRNWALVVGSGLGDDAEALAGRGWAVTAFDISEQAVGWAQERFPLSAVDYQVRSLFELPEDWREGFDLVVEIHTIQSLPVTRRQAAIRAIARTVAQGGTVIVAAMMRDVHVALQGRPWPLTDAELESFARYGLVETSRVVVDKPTRDHPGRVRSEFTRPA